MDMECCGMLFSTEIDLRKVTFWHSTSNLIHVARSKITTHPSRWKRQPHVTWTHGSSSSNSSELWMDPSSIWKFPREFFSSINGNFLKALDFQSAFQSHSYPQKAGLPTPPITNRVSWSRYLGVQNAPGNVPQNWANLCLLGEILPKESKISQVRIVMLLYFVILFWLVVWNINFIFPYIGNFIIPTDKLIFFRGVGIPPTSIVRCYSWKFYPPTKSPYSVSGCLNWCAYRAAQGMVQLHQHRRWNSWLHVCRLISLRHPQNTE